ncbi:hypothetical protein SAMN05444380_1078 [Thermophagus xiamenensis]|uniref:Uncharacterized protein n=1 Tax=Thermophagus xiamenensis TaxID=385682 RepID=A0A1I1XY44_9BACT|nr:hypothetical protein SAMN05444380_1078 [Thermophagus xiamenensis]
MTLFFLASLLYFCSLITQFAEVPFAYNEMGMTKKVCHDKNMYK